MNEERIEEIDVEAEDRDDAVQDAPVENPVLLGLSQLLTELLTELRAMHTTMRERPRMRHPERPTETEEKIKITEI